MNRIAVFIATTAGPVRVERITRERAPQSMVCLKRSSTILPISAGYDSFVRQGSGVIERTFGPFEDGAFRLDVSAPIETGESWQLGVFVAHAVAKATDAALASEDEADTMVWLTGQVDHDLAVGSVGHLTEKVHAASAAMAEWLERGRSVTVVVRDGPDAAAVRAAGLPDDVKIVPVTSATDALHAIGLVLPAMPAVMSVASRRIRKGSSARWLLAGFAAAAVAGIALARWPGLFLTPPPALQALLAQKLQKVETPTITPTIQMPAPQASPAFAIPVAPPTAPVTETSTQPEPTKTAKEEATTAEQPPAKTASPADTPAASPWPKVAMFERRAPAGRTCAEVQFGRVAAVEVPIPEKGAALSTSALPGLCGLAVAVDNGDQPHFVAVMLHILSGKLLYGSDRPDFFGGQVSFGGRREWAIDVPRRLASPFELRVMTISGHHSVVDAATWFSTQPDATTAVKTLVAQGLKTSILQHRVAP